MDKKLLEHLYHPFYKKVDEFTNQVRLTQIKKGAEKYPEPFTPSSWTGEELGTHVLQELRDAQVYTVGLMERVQGYELAARKIRKLIPQDAEDYVEIMMLLDELEGK